MAQEQNHIFFYSLKCTQVGGGDALKILLFDLILQDYGLLQITPRNDKVEICQCKNCFINSW